MTASKAFIRIGQRRIDLTHDFEAAMQAVEDFVTSGRYVWQPNDGIFIYEPAINTSAFSSLTRSSSAQSICDTTRQMLKNLYEPEV